MDENEKQDTVEQVEVAEPEGPKPLFSEEELHNIRAIKLNNGEDIICTIHALNNNMMVVRRPCKILRIANSDGTATVILLKWHVFSNDETCIIQMSAVVSTVKITEEMKEFYIKSVEKQIREESEEKKTPVEGFEWPEWMDEAIAANDKKLLN